MSLTKLSVAARGRFKQKTRHLTNSCVMSPCPRPSQWRVTPQALSTQQQCGGRFASVQSSDCRSLRCRRGKDDERKDCIRFFSSSHLDLHPPLPGGLVFSNQPLIYGNIWRLAEVGHFSMQISLLGLVQCGPPRKKIYNMRSNVIVAFRICSLSP